MEIRNVRPGPTGPEFDLDGRPVFLATKASIAERGRALVLALDGDPLELPAAPLPEDPYLFEPAFDADGLTDEPLLVYLALRHLERTMEDVGKGFGPLPSEPEAVAWIRTQLTGAGIAPLPAGADRFAAD